MGQSMTSRRLPVLIIEDEPILRIDIADMVERAGFEPIEVTNVDEAILVLEQRLDIRIVYMDLDMPRGIKGIEIAASIRDRWPPIEIILTASSFKESELTLPARSEFYPKPIGRDQVIAAMKRMTEHLPHADV